MKQYKLAAWPDLSAPFTGMPYRRMLHAMSQRHVTLKQLSRHSGLERSAVQRFIDLLAEREYVVARNHSLTLALLGRMQRRFGLARRG